MAGGHPQVGAVSVRVRPDLTRFMTELTTGANATVRRINSERAINPLKIRVELDKSSVAAAVSQLRSELAAFKDHTVTVKVRTESVGNLSAALQQQMSSVSADLKANYDAAAEAIEERLKQVSENVAESFRRTTSEMEEGLKRVAEQGREVSRSVSPAPGARTPVRVPSASQPVEVARVRRIRSRDLGLRELVSDARDAFDAIQSASDRAGKALSSGFGSVARKVGPQVQGALGSASRSLGVLNGKLKSTLGSSSRSLGALNDKLGLLNGKLKSTATEARWAFAIIRDGALSGSRSMEKLGKNANSFKDILRAIDPKLWNGLGDAGSINNGASHLVKRFQSLVDRIDLPSLSADTLMEGFEGKKMKRVQDRVRNAVGKLQKEVAALDFTDAGNAERRFVGINRQLQALANNTSNLDFKEPLQALRYWSRQLAAMEKAKGLSVFTQFKKYADDSKSIAKMGTAWKNAYPNKLPVMPKFELEKAGVFKRFSTSAGSAFSKVSGSFARLSGSIGKGLGKMGGLFGKTGAKLGSVFGKAFSSIGRIAGPALKSLGSVGGRVFKSLGNVGGRVFKVLGKGSSLMGKSLNVIGNVMMKFGPLGKVAGLATKAAGGLFRLKKSAGGLKKLGGLFGGASKGASGLGSAFEGMGKKAQGGSRRTVMGLTRIGWIVTAVTALAGPAIAGLGAAFAALPAVALGAAAILGVTAAGFEGIKNAAKAAGPALDTYKKEMSSVFEARLTPQFQALGAMLPKITDSSKLVAGGLSDISGKMVEVITSSEGVGAVNSILSKMGGVLTGLAPAAGIFTQGLLTAADAGMTAFQGLGGWMTQFATQWKTDIDGLVQSGTFQAAISGLGQVLGTAMEGIHQILVAGVQVMPMLAGPLSSLLSGFANAIVALMPVLGSLSGNLASVLGMALNALGGLIQSMSGGFIQIFDTLGSVIGQLIGQVGPVLQAIGQVFTSTVAPAISGVVEVMGGALMGIIQELSAWLPVIAAFIGNIITAMTPLTTMIGNVIKTVISWVMPAIADLLPIVTAIISEVVRSLGFLEFLGPVIGFVANVVIRLIQIALTPVFMILKMINDAIQWVIDKLKSLGDKFGWVGKAAGLFGKFFKKSAVEVKSDANDMSSGVDMSITTMGSKMGSFDGMSKLQAAFNTGKDGVVSTAGAMTNGVNNQMTTMSNLMQTSVQNGVSGATAAFDIGAPGFQAAAERVSSGGYGAFDNLSSHMQTSVQTGMAGANTEFGLQGTQMQGIAQQTADGVNSALGTMGQTTVTDSAQVWQSVVTTFQNGAAAAVEATNTGIQGVHNAWGNLEGNMVGVATQLWAEVKYVFDDSGSGLVSAVTSAIDGVRGAWSGLSSGIADTASQVWEQTSTSFRNGVDQCVQLVSGGVDQLGGKMDSLSSMMVSKAQSMQQKVVSAVQQMMDRVVSAIRDGVDRAAREAERMPSEVERRVSGRANSSSLFSSGQAMVQSFANGIRSKMSAAFDAAKAGMDRISRLFPHSPALEGPFSGRGYTTYSGQALMEGFVDGMASMKSKTVDSTSNILSAVQSVFSGSAMGGNSFGNAMADMFNMGLRGNVSEQLKQTAKVTDAFLPGWMGDMRSTLNAGFGRIATDVRNHTTNVAMGLNHLSWLAKQGMDGAKDAGIEGFSQWDHLRWEARRSFDGILADARDFTDQLGRELDVENFSELFKKALVDAGLPDLQLNFTFENLKQLQKDLGMGDGVASRLFEATLKFDPVFKDSEYEQAVRKQAERGRPVSSGGASTVVNYNVGSVDEALRLEDARRRRELLAAL